MAKNPTFSRTQTEQRGSFLGRFNKKANIIDALIIVIICFIMGIFFLVFYLVVNNISSPIADHIDVQEGRDIMGRLTSIARSFDYLYVILIGMLITGSVISAFFIRSHPIFFIIATITLFIFLIPATALSNAFEKFKAQDKIADIVDNFPIIEFFIDKLPIILIATMILIMIVLYINKEGLGLRGQEYT